MWSHSQKQLVRSDRVALYSTYFLSIERRPLSHSRECLLRVVLEVDGVRVK